uniref:Uncharacterized protein n=1 Tax=Romanomermis culicivorax TaxID=13658 RepID=A0A915HR03_ROMCU
MQPYACEIQPSASEMEPPTRLNLSSPRTAKTISTALSAGETQPTASNTQPSASETRPWMKPSSAQVRRSDPQ